MEWFRLLPQLLSLLTTIVQAAQQRTERGIGRAEALSQILIETQKEVARAKMVRLNQRRRDAAADDPRLHDDGFQRKD